MDRIQRGLMYLEDLDSCGSWAFPQSMSCPVKTSGLYYRSRRLASTNVYAGIAKW